MRPGDPNAWELTAPEEEPSRWRDAGVPLHTHTLEGSLRHLDRAWTVLWVKVARAVAGALAGGWRP